MLAIRGLTRSEFRIVRQLRRPSDKSLDEPARGPWPISGDPVTDVEQIEFSSA